MHLNGLNLNLLVSLDALLSEKSVTRAAQRVNVTQPAMSVALRQLRDHLSDPLLEKIGSRLELTPRAREMATPVKELLLRIETVLRADERFVPETSARTFKVAMTTLMLDLFGPPLVRYLVDRAPKLNFEFIICTKDTLQRVEDGELDLCISVADDDNVGRLEALLSKHFFTDEFVVVAAAANENIGVEMSYDEFCEMPYIELRLNSLYAGLPEQELERHRKRPRVKAVMPTSRSLMAAVSQSNAIAIVPSLEFARHRHSLNLKSVKPPIDLPKIQRRCFWHARNSADKGHQWCLETMIAIAQQYNFQCDEGLF